MKNNQLSLHFLFASKNILKKEYYDVMETIITDVVTDRDFGFELKAFSIQPDHFHLITVINKEHNSNGFDDMTSFLVGKFINRMVIDLTEGIELMFKETISFDDSINVMGFPYSHLRVIMTYVNNQDDVHKEISLEEEIETIFQSEKSIEKDINGLEKYRNN